MWTRLSTYFCIVYLIPIFFCFARITHHSCPHRCHQSSLVNCHTSRSGGCNARLHTETQMAYTWETSAGLAETNHKSPKTHPAGFCSQFAHHTACLWADRCQTARRKRSQGWCSSGRRPRHSRPHSHPRHCKGNVEICTVCCGRQIHLFYTTGDL